jgi:hypothetical protein
MSYFQATFTHAMKGLKMSRFLPFSNFILPKEKANHRNSIKEVNFDDLTSPPPLYILLPLKCFFLENEIGNFFFPPLGTKRANISSIFFSKKTIYWKEHFIEDRMLRKKANHSDYVKEEKCMLLQFFKS